MTATPAIIGIGVLSVVFAFAQLNILAKRARDIGLPGWLTAIVVACLIGGASQMVDHPSAGGIGPLLLIVLTVIPSDALRRSSS